MCHRSAGFALTEILVAYLILALAAVPTSLALAVSIRASWSGISRVRVALAMKEAAGGLSRRSGTGVSCGSIVSGATTTDGIQSVWVVGGTSPRLTVSLRTSLPRGALEVSDSATLYLPCT